MELRTSSSAWWSTHTLQAELVNGDGFNAALAGIILNEEVRLQSERGTPVAGLDHGLTTLWRQYNVLNWPYQECQTLADILLQAARAYFATFADPDSDDYSIVGIAAWANVLRSGQSMHIHHHDQAFVNAHYFVQVGDDELDPAAPGDSGHTVYYRPGFIERSHGERSRDVINPWDADWRVSLAPRPGTLMFFPGYVRHEVRPYLGRRERISIAFDLYIQKQEPLIYFGGPQWFVPQKIDESDRAGAR